MKIGLGTVQFGLDYGISNPDGKTDEAEVARVLASAQHCGIRIVDTAAGYGNSEEVLGRNLPEGHGFSIVTKTPAFSSSSVTSADTIQLEQAFRHSLCAMRLDSLYGLMLHRADDLLSENGFLLLGKMRELQQQGLRSENRRVGIYGTTDRENSRPF